MLRWWVRRLRRDEGAAAIEFALIFPIFAILAFGTMAAGFAFARQINITQAARETSRFGSTLSINAAGGTIRDWFTQVDDAATGAAGSGAFSGYTTRCIAYVVGATKQYSTDGGNNISTGDHCPGASAPAGLTNYVQVVMTRKTDFNFIVADPTLTLQTVSSTPYEATDS